MVDCHVTIMMFAINIYIYMNIYVYAFIFNNNISTNKNHPMYLYSILNNR